MYKSVESFIASLSAAFVFIKCLQTLRYSRLWEKFIKKIKGLHCFFFVFFSSHRERTAVHPRRWLSIQAGMFQWRVQEPMCGDHAVRAQCAVYSGRHIAFEDHELSMSAWFYRRCWRRVQTRYNLVQFRCLPLTSFVFNPVHIERTL